MFVYDSLKQVSFYQYWVHLLRHISVTSGLSLVPLTSLQFCITTFRYLHYVCLWFKEIWNQVRDDILVWNKCHFTNTGITSQAISVRSCLNYVPFPFFSFLITIIKYLHIYLFLWLQNIRRRDGILLWNKCNLTKTGITSQAMARFLFLSLPFRFWSPYLNIYNKCLSIITHKL